MASIKFFRATPDNKLFDRLETSWSKQIPAEEKPWLKVTMDYAKKIAFENPQDFRYGIFVLCDPNGDNKPGAPYEAFAHVNHAHPHTQNPELRVVWNAIAPKYTLDSQFKQKKAQLLGAYINGALELSKTEMPSSSVKLYLGNDIDIEFARAFVASAIALGIDRVKPAVRGSWLHLDWS